MGGYLRVGYKILGNPGDHWGGFQRHPGSGRPTEWTSRIGPWVDRIPRCARSNMASRDGAIKLPIHVARLDKPHGTIEIALLALSRDARILPAAVVTALPRPISDHTPIIWKSQGEIDRPPYFKMDRSWFREEGFAEDLANWWEAHPARGFASTRFVMKLSELRHHLIGWRRRIREDRTRNRDGALSAIQELDVLEDT